MQTLTQRPGAYLMRCITLILAIMWSPVSTLADILNVQPVAPGIWSIEGPAAQRTPENLGNNATFGRIETNDGTVLIDTGGTWAGAAMLHNAIQNWTDQPATYVINTGGQDHRWLGNGYWKTQGATIIASSAAVSDQEERESLQLTMLSQLVGEGLEGTEPVHADVTFETGYVLDLGGRRIEIIHPGAAHTPGDSFVWLPAERTVFTGDIVYAGRLLSVMDFSDSASWLEAFGAIEDLEPMHLIPGHGPLTTLEHAQADTRDYLENLRKSDANLY